jgi:hypothetical protein
MYVNCNVRTAHIDFPRYPLETIEILGTEHEILPAIGSDKIPLPIDRGSSHKTWFRKFKITEVSQPPGTVIATPQQFGSDLGSTSAFYLASDASFDLEQEFFIRVDYDHTYMNLVTSTLVESSVRYYGFTDRAGHPMPMGFRPDESYNIVNGSVSIFDPSLFDTLNRTRFTKWEQTRTLERATVTLKTFAGKLKFHKLLSLSDYESCIDISPLGMDHSFFDSLESPTLEEATVAGGASYYGVITKTLPWVESITMTVASGDPYPYTTANFYFRFDEVGIDEENTIESGQGADHDGTYYGSLPPVFESPQNSIVLMP